MEEMPNENEFEDIAKYIGNQIPNVASGNADPEGLSSISVTSYEGSSMRDYHSNRNLMDGNISMSTLQQSSMDHTSTRQNFVPGDQSLTRAFEKLNFGDESKVRAWKSRAILLENHYSDNLSKQLQNIDPSVFAAWSSSNHLTNGVHDPHSTRLGHQNSPSRYIPEQYKKWQTGQLQPFEALSPNAHLTHEVANVSSPNSQFPIASQRQQVLHNGRRCIHPQQMNHRQVGWNYAEEDQLYRMHEQHPYLQHLHNQQLERLLPIQQHENIAGRISSQNRKPQYYEVPIAHHLEQSNHEPSWKPSAFCRGSNQLNSVFSTHYMDTVQESPSLKLVPERFNSVDEVRGRIFLMAKDQHGCRFLQRKFMEGTDEDIEKIFNEIIDRVVELMMDAFGNYLVQKLLEVCNDNQRMQILCRITQNHGELVMISCDMHGTRAIQKVIETLKTQEQVHMIVSALKSGIVTLMKNINGNHVAQHCLDYLMPSCRELLFDAARNSCVDLAVDRHGCCVLQKCLSCSDSTDRDNLINEITQNALIISQDQYGNYVVQFILKLNLRWATEAILKQLEGNYGDLSMQKYSSNVVEKCLQFAGGQNTKIVLELINDPRFDKIMQDPYGNYAIQTALNNTEGTLHTKLVEAIRPHVPVLRMSPYGKKVLAIVGKSN